MQPTPFEPDANTPAGLIASIDPSWPAAWAGAPPEKRGEIAKDQFRKAWSNLGDEIADAMPNYPVSADMLPGVLEVEPQVEDENGILRGGMLQRTDKAKIADLMVACEGPRGSIVEQGHALYLLTSLVLDRILSGARADDLAFSEAKS